MSVLRRFMLSQKRLVTFNDPIHGTIQLDWKLGEIINTPEFQRLHHIKQLSSTFHVYPEAQHTRFGHSIGTAHLAGKLVTHLQRSQPDLKIEEDDVLCVQIAGLCHDLGHGPYSHLFDEQFLPRIGVTDDWTHEESSCRMFDKIVARISQRNDDLLNFFEKKGYCNFIKQMIHPSGNGNYSGRNADKHFLFQMISNKTSGVDVDKWDYFARDCHHLGIANSFNHERFIKFTRVISVPEDGGPKQHICVMKKEAFNLYGMFHARFALHKRACQHKRKNAIDHMICDALEAAHDHINVAGVKGIKTCIARGKEETFSHLDDRILLQIQHSGDDAPVEMKHAKRILSRISEGDHYIIIDDIPLEETFGNKAEKREKEREIMLSLDKHPLLKGKIRVTIANFNYGKGAKDPISLVWFYEDGKPDKALKVKRKDVSRILPSEFEENRLQVFCTDNTLEVVEQAKKALAESKWGKQQNSST